MIKVYNGKMPVISNSAFVFEHADVLGDVRIAEDVSVWCGACIRGDSAPVTIGAGSNIQENVTIHTSPGHSVLIGTGVTVGHNAVVHGCTIGNNVLIGMGAIVLDGAVIEDDSIIGAGALVSQGKRIPRGSLVVGLPGKVSRELNAQEIESIKFNAAEYEGLMNEYRKQ